ncbi:MAG: hypothetical protein KBG21_05455 [Ignavibacteria bacterium]|nr:hypothetical protein [Ignavibacteria bacterium]
MENIYVEANENFYFGFVLTEQELRRIIETIDDQLKKTHQTENLKFNYELKYENGIVAKTDNIEDLFQQENTGSSKIMRLMITGQIGLEVSFHQIQLTFTNPKSEEESPIKYKIKGKSRDWVFVASSTLEERVRKVKRIPIDPTQKKKTYVIFKTLTLPLVMLAAMLVLISSIKLPKNGEIENIENKWKIGELKDPIEAVILIQKMNEHRGEINPFYIMLTPILYVGIVYISLLVIWYLSIKIYPLYNFCWGDYLTSFNRIENLRKTLLWVVLTGLALSIIGSLIATYLLNLKFF